MDRWVFLGEIWTTRAILYAISEVSASAMIKIRMCSSSTWAVAGSVIWLTATSYLRLLARYSIHGIARDEPQGE